MTTMFYTRPMAEHNQEIRRQIQANRIEKRLRRNAMRGAERPSLLAAFRASVRFAGSSLPREGPHKHRGFEYGEAECDG